jgi:multisite-specific tRNA:(cytosine-C5)-methyltransferase
MEKIAEGVEPSPPAEGMEEISEVLETVQNEDGQEGEQPPQYHSGRNNGKGKPFDRGGGGNGSFKESPFTYLSPDDPVLLSCLYGLSSVTSILIFTVSNRREKLNIDSSFPSRNVLVRNPAGEPARSLYLTNDVVKQIIDSNGYVRIRLVTSGTKMFGRQEGKGADMSFRVLGEGLPVVLPFIPAEFILTGDALSLKTLMRGYYPLTTSFPKQFRSIVESQCKSFVPNT